jgi:hypothetical protein
VFLRLGKTRKCMNTSSLLFQTFFIYFSCFKYRNKDLTSSILVRTEPNRTEPNRTETEIFLKSYEPNRAHLCSIYYYISFILGFITRRDILQTPFLSIPNLFSIVFRFYRDLFLNIQREISGAYPKLDNSIPCKTLFWPKEILQWMTRLMSFIASLSFSISMQLLFRFGMLTD